MALNHMHMGSSSARTVGYHTPKDQEVQVAQKQAQSIAMQESKRYALERRNLGLTGVQAATALLKIAPHEGFLCRNGRATHTTFVADRVDEPLSCRTVDMLEALPPCQRCH